MEDIIQYMLRNREERRAHLKLEQECSEIGGSGSIEYKGLLAYHLGTTIPTKMKFKIQEKKDWILCTLDPDPIRFLTV